MRVSRSTNPPEDTLRSLTLTPESEAEREYCEKLCSRIKEAEAEKNKPGEKRQVAENAADAADAAEENARRLRVEAQRAEDEATGQADKRRQREAEENPTPVPPSPPVTSEESPSSGDEPVSTPEF